MSRSSLIVEVWQWCLGQTQGTTLVDGSRRRCYIAGSLHSCRPITMETSERRTAGGGAGLRRDSAVGKPACQVSSHTVKSPDDRHRGLCSVRGTSTCLHDSQIDSCAEETWQSLEKATRWNKGKAVHISFLLASCRLWRYRAGQCRLTFPFIKSLWAAIM